MRLNQIDGARGFFLLSMMLGHLASFIPSHVGRLTHHSNGFVDSAQGFVTISGIVIGLVFGRRLLHDEVGVVRRKLLSRIGVLWRWQVFLLASVIVISACLPNVPTAIAAQAGDMPWLTALLGATLISGPVFVDILPMYLIFMVFTPAALVAINRGQWARVAAVSLMAWALGQTNIPEIALRAFFDQTGLVDQGAYVALYFNRLGWQVLYFAGLAGGFLMAQNRLSLGFMHGVIGRNLALASILLAIVFFALPRLVAYGGLEVETNNFLFSLFDRQSMTPLRIAVFAAHFYLALWILIVAPTARARWMRSLSHKLNALLTWRPLVLLGQHSLPVYAWHVLLCYLLAIFAATGLNAAPWFIREVVAVLTALTLFVPAIFHAQFQRYVRVSRPVHSFAARKSI